MKHSRRTDGRPAFQFYPDDWLAETGLRMCDLAARGLWIDLLCHAFKMESRGELRVGDRPLTDAEIASLVGRPRSEVEAAMKQLEEWGVLERKPDGTIYSRRMVRDERLRRARQDAGREGGRRSKPKAKPKAKGGSPTPSPASSPSSTPQKEEEEALLLERVCSEFNRIGEEAGSKARCAEPAGITAKARSVLLGLMRTEPEFRENIETIFRAFHESPGLSSGDYGISWIAQPGKWRVLLSEGVADEPKKAKIREKQEKIVRLKAERETFAETNRTEFCKRSKWISELEEEIRLLRSGNGGRS